MPAGDDAEVEAVVPGDHREIDREAVKRNGNREQPRQPRAVPVHGLARPRYVRDHGAEGREAVGAAGEEGQQGRQLGQGGIDFHFPPAHAGELLLARLHGLLDHLHAPGWILLVRAQIGSDKGYRIGGIDIVGGPQGDRGHGLEGVFRQSGLVDQVPAQRARHDGQHAVVEGAAVGLAHGAHPLEVPGLGHETPGAGNALAERRLRALVHRGRQLLVDAHPHGGVVPERLADMHSAPKLLADQLGHRLHFIFPRVHPPRPGLLQRLLVGLFRLL